MKMNLKPSLINCIFGLILINTTIAQGLKASQNFIKNRDWGFLPNQGQLADEHGNALSDIKYYGHQGGVQLYCRANKISFVFTKVEQEESNSSESGEQVDLPNFLRQNNHQNDKIYTTRADMMLMGANPNPKIIATEQQAHYENYYLAQSSEEETTNVHTFKTLTYQSIYPYIDLVLHTRAKGIKYEYIVHPGGKVSNIQMQWFGLASADIIAGGGIRYNMMLGKNKTGMEESAPISFTDKGKVTSSFIMKGNRIGFKVAKYSNDETLTIDPNLEWGTYFGDSLADVSMAMKVDAFGNAYMCGYTNSIRGIATTGAFQTVLSTAYDAFVVKYDKYGALLWSTYYGGQGADYAYGLALDSSGNVFISGYTTSNNLVTKNAYLSSSPGNGDVFLTKFNASGSLNWATYFGGAQYDFAYDVAADKSGNVYVGGSTTSSKGIVIGNAYQTSFTGSEDAFIAKFNSIGSPLWSTYYGGNSSTRLQGITTDAGGNIFITGYTYATDIASSGAYQTKIAGGLDAFITKFSSNGNLSWSTYFGGSGTDYGNKISTDASGNVYMTGYTTSTGLASKGAQQTTSYPLSDDVFLVSFSGAGELKWCTYFGGKNVDLSGNICTYRDKYVYICGYTNDSNGIATAGAYQGSYNGQYDGFVAKYKTDGSLVWSTYYGGENADIIYGVGTDSFDNVYFGGYTASQSGISNNAGHRKVFGGSDDGFLVKFSDPHAYDAGVDSIKNPTAQKCEGNIDISISIKNYGTKPLTSLKIGWNVNGVVQKVIQWTGKLNPGASTPVSLGSRYFKAGTYIISAYTNTPNGVFDSVPENDTLNLKFRANALPPTAWSITKTGANYSFHVLDSSLGKFYYLWQLEDGFHYYGYSFVHTFPEKKTYKVQLITTNLLACVNERDSSILVDLVGIPHTPEANTNNISIYPNPFSNKTIIYFNNARAAIVKVSVTDMMGKVLYISNARQYSAGNNEIEINDTDIGLNSAGTYFVSMIIEDKVVVKKVVLIK